jgi:hypothetical protein
LDVNLALCGTRFRHDLLIKMALPSPVHDTYLLYKTGVKAFVQWLVSAARATGMVEGMFTIPNKRENKNKRSAKSQHKPIQVPFSSHGKLAEAIVLRLAAFVPRSIFTILRDAILKRKEYATNYRRSTECAAGNNFNKSNP